ncbi:hypothetical protein CONPUDRAFT_61735, partial [Coniophora puteana RWD-64-598 SS2]
VAVPFFMRHKVAYGYREDQQCCVLNCWSVHQGQQFRDLVCCRWPWIRLCYVPGGCTGNFQPCNVVMQYSYKHSIKRSQLCDTVNDALEHLQVHADSACIKIDTRISMLRD